MLTLSQQEHDRTYKYLDQLSRSGTIDPIRDHSCIYRSHDFPETRLVLKLETQGAMYALKADTQAPITDRLRKEYDLLCQLAEYFDDKKTSQVVRPIYLSSAGDFMVTEYIKRPTAVDHAACHSRSVEPVNVSITAQKPTERADFALRNL